MLLEELLRAFLYLIKAINIAENGESDTETSLRMTLSYLCQDLGSEISKAAKKEKDENDSGNT